MGWLSDPARRELYGSFDPWFAHVSSQARAIGLPEVRCGLVPRPGLGAFTVRAGDSWQIGVHEHTPQVLRAFAALLVQPPETGDIGRFFDIDLQAAPSGLLPQPALAEDLRPVVQGIVELALTFLIAHELGHVSAGQSRSDAHSTVGVRADLPTTYPSAQEEIDADGYAGGLLRLSSSADELVVGSRVFFELSRFIEARMVAGGKSYLASTHPHPVQRLAAVQAFGLTRAEASSALIQEQIDALLDRPPLSRAPASLAELRSIAEQAPAAEVRRYLAAAADDTGRRLDGALRTTLLATDAEAAVCFAAQLYVESNPYRWADPEVAIGFASLCSEYERLTTEDESRRQATLAVVRSAVPELDELIQLGNETVHWTSSGTTGS